MPRSLNDFSNPERLIWEQACDNMPSHNEATQVLGKCLGLDHTAIIDHYVAGTLPGGHRDEILRKLSSPEYGRAFAAIRLTALGVADQYDWGDK